LVSNISLDEYNTLCSALTPSPTHYGISYDSITDQWVKVAAVVERYFSSSPEELDKILDYLGKGKKAPAEEAKPAKKEKEEKPSDEDKKLDDLLNEEPGKGPEEESLPLAGEGQTAPMGGGSNDQDLADLLKKEASEQKCQLCKGDAKPCERCGAVLCDGCKRMIGHQHDPATAEKK
jgi:hypothetical protein